MSAPPPPPRRKKHAHHPIRTTEKGGEVATDTTLPINTSQTIVGGSGFNAARHAWALNDKGEPETVSNTDMMVPETSERDKYEHIIPKRLRDLLTTTPESTVGKGVSARGRLNFQRLMYIQGTFTGTLKSRGSLVVKEGGMFRGELINANMVIIEGKVVGKITCDEVWLVQGSTFLGDITCRSIVIDPDCILVGPVNVHPGLPGDALIAKDVLAAEVAQYHIDMEEANILVESLTGENLPPKSVINPVVNQVMDAGNIEMVSPVKEAQISPEVEVAEGDDNKDEDEKIDDNNQEEVDTEVLVDTPVDTVVVETTETDEVVPSGDGDEEKPNEEETPATTTDTPVDEEVGTTDTHVDEEVGTTDTPVESDTVAEETPVDGEGEGVETEDNTTEEVPVVEGSGDGEGEKTETTEEAPAVEGSGDEVPVEGEKGDVTEEAPAVEGSGDEVPVEGEKGDVTEEAPPNTDEAPPADTTTEETPVEASTEETPPVEEATTTTTEETPVEAPLAEETDTPVVNREAEVVAATEETVIEPTATTDEAGGDGDGGDGSESELASPRDQVASPGVSGDEALQPLNKKTDGDDEPNPPDPLYNVGETVLGKNSGAYVPVTINKRTISSDKVTWKYLVMFEDGSEKWLKEKGIKPVPSE